MINIDSSSKKTHSVSYDFPKVNFLEGSENCYFNRNLNGKISIRPMKNFKNGKRKPEFNREAIQFIKNLFHISGASTITMLKKENGWKFFLYFKKKKVQFEIHEQVSSFLSSLVV